MIVDKNKNVGVVGDVGTEITVETEKDLTGAIEIKLIIIRPDGSKLTVTGTQVDTTKIKYVTVLDDLKYPGKYVVHSYAKYSATKYWKGLGTYFMITKEGEVIVQ